MSRHVHVVRWSSTGVPTACLSLREESDERNITISLPQTKIPLILADAQWLELILQNLIFNAIAHSPCGATVSLKTTMDSGYCEIKIENPMADPLSTKDLDFIFKRFWRKDVARESGRHAGIGLSLVKSYIELMGLDVHAKISGSRFCLVLSGIKIA